MAGGSDCCAVHVSGKGENLKYLCDVLYQNGTVVCAVSAGAVILARSDTEEAMSSLRRTAGKNRSECIFRCVPDLDAAWKIWHKSVKTQELNSFISHLLPDMAIIIAPAASRKIFADREGKRKAGVWTCTSGIVNQILNSVCIPLAGVFADFEEGADLTKRSGILDALKKSVKGADAYAYSGTENAGLHPLVLDVSSFDWRIISLGCYNFEELKSLTEHRFLLSGDSRDNSRLKALFAANISIYEGDSLRISRRLHSLLEQNESLLRTSVFFVSTRCIYDTLKNIERAVFPDENFSMNIIYPMFLMDPDVCGGEEYTFKTSDYFKEKLEKFRFDENIRTVFVESCSCSKEAEYFSEYVKSIANQIVFAGAENNIDVWQ